MFIVLRFYMHIINSLKSLWRVFCNVKRIRLLLFLIYNVDNHDFLFSHKSKVFTVNVTFHELYKV